MDRFTVATTGTPSERHGHLFRVVIGHQRSPIEHVTGNERVCPDKCQRRGQHGVTGEGVQQTAL